MSDLHPYEDHDVIMSTIRVTNAGDGLSQALAVEPTEFRHGDTVYVVLETEVAKVAYEPVTDTEALKRVHTLRAGTGTIVDHAAVAGLIDAQRAANERARGIERLPMDEDVSS